MPPIAEISKLIEKLKVNGIKDYKLAQFIHSLNTIALFEEMFLMKACIIQPSYLPWPGYYSMLNECDYFVVFDNVPFDKNGYRNRNRILYDNHPRWMTLSVDKSSVSINDKNKLIKDTLLVDNLQFSKHLRLLQCIYTDSAYLQELSKIYPETLNVSKKLVRKYSQSN